MLDKIIKYMCSLPAVMEKIDKGIPRKFFTAPPNYFLGLLFLVLPLENMQHSILPSWKMA